MVSPARSPRAPASALVTGASSGIGAALARALAARGHPLVLVARSRAGLEAVVADLDVPARLVAADLATEDGLRAAEDALAGAEPPVGVLVNNAGSAVHGPLVGQTPETITHAVALNVLAPTRLTAAALRHLAPGATVVNVSSIAAGIDDPGVGVYAAGKAHLESLSRTARREATGVGVLVVRPGWTRTAFHPRSGEDVTAVPTAQWQSPDDVARAVLEAVDAGQQEITVVPPDPRGLPRRLVGRARHRLRVLLGRHR